MNFKRFLSFAFVLPLLASCGVSTSKAKKPSFNNYSNKVDYATYVSEFTKAYAETPLMETEEKKSLTSLKLTTVKSVVNKKDFNLSTAYNEDIEKRVGTEVKYDATNDLMEVQTNTGISSKQNYLSYTVENEASNKSNNVIQVDEIDSVKKVVSYDLIGKTYTVTGDADEAYKDELNASMKSKINSNIALDKLLVPTYESESEEEKAKYSFYQDKKIFTLVYETSVENTIYNIKDSTTEIGVEKIKTVKKMQINLTSNNLKYLSSDVSDREYTFTASGVFQDSFDIDVKSGDNGTTKVASYFELKLEFTDVKINRQEIGKYTNTGDEN